CAIGTEQARDQTILGRKRNPGDGLNGAICFTELFYLDHDHGPLKEVKNAGRRCRSTQLASTGIGCSASMKFAITSGIHPTLDTPWPTPCTVTCWEFGRRSATN